MNLITVVPPQHPVSITFTVSDQILDLLEDLQIVETCDPKVLAEIRALTQRAIAKEAKRHND